MRGKMKDWQKRKQTILELMNNELYVPMKEKELAILLRVEAADRPLLKQALEELLEEKKIQINKRGKYSLFDARTAAKNADHLVGTFISHQKGFGFVEVDGREEDLFIPEGKINGAYHLDTVEVALLPRHGGNGRTHGLGGHQRKLAEFGNHGSCGGSVNAILVNQSHQQQK